MSHKKLRGFVLLLALLVPAIVACGAAISPTTTPKIAIIEPAFGSQLARGQELYAANCASCHGQNGEGSGPFPALNSGQHAYSHPDWEYFVLIENGKNGMPAFKGRLNNEQMTDIIARMKAWWGPGELSEQRQLCLLVPPPTAVAN